MRRLRREEWKEAIAEQESGIESQREYCLRRDISAKSFAYWKKRLKPLPGPAFIEVPHAKPEHSGKAELILPDGVVFRVEW